MDRAVRVANSTTMRRRLILSVGLLALAGAAVVAQDQAPNRRDFTLIARDHQFTPNRIEVTKDDLVRITLTSEGRPYSFAIDAYHILKRVGAGKTIVFDFRADQAGDVHLLLQPDQRPRVPRDEGHAGGGAEVDAAVQSVPSSKGLSALEAL